MVTVVGKITQLKQPTTVGSPRKRLHLVEATFTDSTGSIPLELWEDHIAILKSGQCYKMTSVQVKVWCNRKKVTTTKKTIITETSDESLKPITLQHDPEDSLTNATIKEVICIRHVEKFFICYICLKKIVQSGSSAVLRCKKCGIIKATQCTLGLSATIEVLNDKQDSLTLKMNVELLKELINEDVLHFDKNALAEKLLFIENFAVKYDDNFTVVSVILQKNKIE